VGGSGTPHIAHGNVTEGASTLTWATISTTWTTETGAWSDTDVLAANDGLVGIDVDNDDLALMDWGDSAAVDSIQAIVSRESLDFGDQTIVKLCTEVWPR